GAQVRGTRFCCGLRAWNSDPELYRKTSVISPVESRVLTMLSPSLPPGRVCTWTVMSGFLAWKAAARPCAGLVLPSLLSTRKLSVAPPLLSLEPRLPALQAPSTRMQATTAARSGIGRHGLARLMSGPPRRRPLVGSGTCGCEPIQSPSCQYDELSCDPGGALTLILLPVPNGLKRIRARLRVQEAGQAGMEGLPAADQAGRCERVDQGAPRRVEQES